MEIRTQDDLYMLKAELKSYFFRLFLLCIFNTPLFFPGAVFAAAMGPFHLPAVGFSEMFRETPMFISPEDHVQGRVQFTLAARWFNVWTFNVEADRPYDWEEGPDTFPFEHGSFLLDMETVSANPRISVKISDRVRMEAEIPVIYQSGGILDGVIEGFHDIFGIDQHSRDKWERNGTSLLYVSPDGDIIDSSRDVPGTFLGNLVLGGSYRFKDAGPAMGIRVLCKLPTSTMDDGWKQNGIDVSVQTTMSWTRDRISGYHGVGATFYGSDGIDELALKNQRYTIMNSLEYAWSDGFSLLAHLVAASPVADYPELDNPVIELTLGFKKRIGKGVFEFGVIENLFFFDNSPDIGVHAAYTFNAF